MPYIIGTNSEGVKESQTLFSYRDITESHPHVYEIIESISDDLLNILSDKSLAFLYGGITRDIVAGMKLLGDIDVVSNNAFPIVNSIDESERWLRKSAEENVFETRKYKQASNNKLSLTSYINTYGYELQIIQYPIQQAYDPVQGRYRNQSSDKTTSTDVLRTIAEHVDLRCCCLVMWPDGRIAELVEGAENDCVDKILHLNPCCNKSLDPDRLEERILKLTDRGWVLSEELAQFLAELKEQKDKQKKEVKKQESNEVGYFKIKQIFIKCGCGTGYTDYIKTIEEAIGKIVDCTKNLCGRCNRCKKRFYQSDTSIVLIFECSSCKSMRSIAFNARDFKRPVDKNLSDIIHKRSTGILAPRCSDCSFKL